MDSICLAFLVFSYNLVRILVFKVLCLVVPLLFFLRSYLENFVLIFRGVGFSLKIPPSPAGDSSSRGLVVKIINEDCVYLL